MLPEFYVFLQSVNLERWQSGRTRTLGKRVYRKVTWVRIPPFPQNASNEVPPFGGIFNFPERAKALAFEPSQGN